MFSATGNILSGSQNRPDTYTISIKEGNGFRSSSTLSSTNCTLNKIGYIPGVSTITGCGRALLGIVHSIVHLASAIFDSKNRSKHLEEAKLGGKNIGRGLVEMIPVIGNITMSVVDVIRMNKFGKQAEEVMRKNPNEYKNQVTLFAYGKEIAKRTVDEVNAELAKLPENKKPSQADIINILQNKV